MSSKVSEVPSVDSTKSTHKKYTSKERKEKKEKKKEKREKSKHSQQSEDVPVKTSKKRSRRDSTASTEKSPHKKAKRESKVELPVATNNRGGDEFRKAHNITLFGEDTDYAPVTSFADVGFAEDLVASTARFQKPTPIQAQTWPILMAMRDVVGIAETGSGKTLAFGMPGMSLIKNRKAGSKGKPLMLVVAPTKELAQQSHDVLAEVGKQCKPPITSVAIYGGIPKDRQTAALRKGAEIIVACPGRLLDLVSSNVCDLSEVSYIVLDEADRMLDMGFEKSIREIFGLVKKQRQTLMFSATWPTSIRLLAREFLNNPVRVVIGTEDLKANSNVKQIVEVIDIDHRDRRLLDLMKQYHKKGEKTIVFVLYKLEAARIERFLTSKGYSCVAIHGDKSAPQRSSALESFKKGNPPILVATDVAARGLDIPKVEYVINFSFPLGIEDYVHRIGRTGRAGATGISHTFFHTFDKPNSGELIAVLRAAKADIPDELMQMGTTTKRKEPKVGKIDMNVQASGRITFDDSDDDE